MSLTGDELSRWQHKAKLREHLEKYSNSMRTLQTNVDKGRKHLQKLKKEINDLWAESKRLDAKLKEARHG